MAITINSPKSGAAFKDTTTYITWAAVSGQTAYELCYRRKGATTWQTLGKTTSTSNSVSIQTIAAQTGITTFTDYDYKVIIYSTVNNSLGTLVNQEHSAAYKVVFIQETSKGTLNSQISATAKEEYGLYDNLGTRESTSQVNVAKDSRTILHAPLVSTDSSLAGKTTAKIGNEEKRIALKTPKWGKDETTETAHGYHSQYVPQYYIHNYISSYYLTNYYNQYTYSTYVPATYSTYSYNTANYADTTGYYYTVYHPIISYNTFYGTYNQQYTKTYTPVSYYSINYGTYTYYSYSVYHPVSYYSINYSTYNYYGYTVYHPVSYYQINTHSYNKETGRPAYYGTYTYYSYSVYQPIAGYTITYNTYYSINSYLTGAYNTGSTYGYQRIVGRFYNHYGSYCKVEWNFPTAYTVQNKASIICGPNYVYKGPTGKVDGKAYPLWGATGGVKSYYTFNASGYGLAIGAYTYISTGRVYAQVYAPTASSYTYTKVPVLSSRDYASSYSIHHDETGRPAYYSTYYKRNTHTYQPVIGYNITYSNYTYYSYTTFYGTYNQQYIKTYTPISSYNTFYGTYNRQYINIYNPILSYNTFYNTYTYYGYTVYHPVSYYSSNYGTYNKQNSYIYTYLSGYTPHIYTPQETPQYTYINTYNQGPNYVIHNNYAYSIYNKSYSYAYYS